MKKGNLILVIFALGLVISLKAESYPPDGWRLSVPLVTATEVQRFSDVAAEGNNVHTIWADNREGSYRLYYKKSTDAGFTWSNEIPISLPSEIISGEPRNICIAIGDYLYVVYAIDDEVLNTYALIFCRSTNNGETWEGYQSIDVNLSTLPQPSMTIAEDSIRVVFCDYPDIVYVASGDNGNTWHSYDHLNFGEPIHLQWPDITTANNRPYFSCVYHNVIAYARHLGANWELYGWAFEPCDNFYYSRIVADNSGNLCMAFGYKNIIFPEIRRSIWRWFSTDGGNNWDGGVIWPPILYSGPENPDLIWDTDYKLILVYGRLPNSDLHGCISTDFGATWGDDFRLADAFNGGEPPAFIPHPSIAKDDVSKHIVFEKWVSNNYDLAHIANDDVLLSNSNRATAFNGGRHLIRDPFCNILHLVYHSQERVHYSFSNDGGTNWAPYHIIEDSETQNKDYGWYPSVALIPGMLAMKPCVVYCSDLGKVKYRWLNEGTGQWQGFTILEAAEGHDPGPPSVVTYGDQVYVVFSVKRLEQSEQLWSAIYFYQFPYDATGAPDPITLDYTPGGPLAYSHVSITVDGNGDPHCVWEKKVSPNNYEDIFYRWRNGPDPDDWDPALGLDPFPVSQQADARSKSPHIDDYGDYLSVVWYNEIAGIPDEIYRRRKRIPLPRWDRVRNYSLSPGIVSEFPVNAADDFTVWHEGPVDQLDIRYRSDTYGFGWVSQAPDRESFCHSQLARDFWIWDLYTIFTKGNTTPYRIVSVRQWFGMGPAGTRSPLYTVETGKDTASVFCVQRESPIQYGGYQVDYAASELIYNLPLLDPIFPFHLIKGTGYFEGTGNKPQELWVNNEKKFAFIVNANQPFNFEIPIPRELYQNEHRITVSIKNPQSDGVYLANLEICRLIDGRHGGGGPQSTNTLPVMAEFTLLRNTANPFVKTTNISYQIPKNCKVFLKIYDIAGQLINTLVHEHQNSGFHTARWDGRDAGGREVSNGIYFIELKSDNESITKKVIKLR